MDTHNRGISISGGNININAMAAGKHAHATSVGHTAPGSVEELRDQMAAFVTLLQSGSVPLDDRQSVLTVANVARDELDKPRPDKQSVLGLLQSVAAGVGSVASLATAVSAIQHAVLSVL